MTHQKILALLAGHEAQKPMPFDTLVEKSGLLPDTLRQVLEQMQHSIPASINTVTITKGGKTQLMVWPTGVVPQRTGPQGIVINPVARAAYLGRAATMRESTANMQPSTAKVQQTASVIHQEQTMSTPSGNSKAGELNRTCLGLIQDNPGITKDDVLLRAAKAVPGATKEKINSTLGNLVTTKKVRSEGKRGHLKYYPIGAAATAAKQEASSTGTFAAQRAAETHAAALADDDLSIFIDDKNILCISTAHVDLELNPAQTARLHAFMRRVSLEVPA